METSQGWEEKKLFVECVDQVSQLHQLEEMSDCNTQEIYLFISIMLYLLDLISH